MNFSLSLDEKTTKSWYPLEPKFNVMKMDDVMAMSDHIAIPKPVISCISSWLSG